MLSLFAMSPPLLGAARLATDPDLDREREWCELERERDTERRGDAAALAITVRRHWNVAQEDVSCVRSRRFVLTQSKEPSERASERRSCL